MASSALNQFLVSHRLLSRAVAVVVAGLILVILAMVPLIAGISKTAGKIKVRDKEERALVDKVSLLTQLDQTVLSERLAVLDLALPPRKDVVAYLAAIEGLSRELGLSFGGLSLSPGEVTEQAEANTPKGKRAVIAGLQTLDTTIKMKGSKDGIYTFLKNVEQTLPLMQIKDVKVAVLSDEQYSLSLSMGMLWASPGTADVKGAVSLFNEQEESYFQTLFGYRSYKSELDSSQIGSFVESGRTDLFSL